jgi:uncharacterized small protein (DUF1192 family)
MWTGTELVTRKLATQRQRFKPEDFSMQDDDLPPPPILSLTKAEIEDLSVPELEERIVALEAEIVRVRHVIATKQDSKSAAEAVFGKR